MLTFCIYAIVSSQLLAKVSWRENGPIIESNVTDANMTAIIYLLHIYIRTVILILHVVAKYKSFVAKTSILEAGEK